MITTVVVIKSEIRTLHALPVLWRVNHIAIAPNSKELKNAQTLFSPSLVFDIPFQQL